MSHESLGSRPRRRRLGGRHLRHRRAGTLAVAVTRPRREFTRQEDLDIVRMRSEGLSLTVIGQSLGRNHPAIIANRLKIIARGEKIYRREWHIRPGPLPETSEIELTKGAIAVIDNIDLPIIEPYFWSLRNDDHRQYAIRNVPGESGKQITMAMHRIIMGTDEDVRIIDHIDGNGLNNRRQNLRITERSFNIANSRRRQDNTSGFKGVWPHGKRWRVNVAGKYQGVFDTIEEAALAYDQRAKELWGEFAQVNFP